MANQRLEKIQATHNTPIEIIKGTVESDTGEVFLKSKRIIGGEANEVYHIVTDKKQYVLRLASIKESDFEKEKWCKEKCKEKKVPVAETIKIGMVKIKEHKTAYSLEEYISGKIPDVWKDDNTIWLPTYEESGKYLSKIHSIKVEGFDYLDKNGTGKFKTHWSYIQEDKLNEEAFNLYLEICERRGIDQEKVKVAYSVLEKHFPKYCEEEACLVHGDFAPKHFITNKDKKIIAILDFGECKGGSPVEDFATWAYWFRAVCPYPVLQKRYQNFDLFDRDFKLKIALYKIIKNLDLIFYYDEIDEWSLQSFVMSNFEEDLSYFL